MDRLWYFAYGSNLCRATFVGRRGMSPLEIRRGRVDGYRLAFDLPVGPGERGVANLVADPAAVTWGACYLLDPTACEHLDRTERGLVRLVNEDASGIVDISAEQTWARDLLDANRLYRQSVRGTGSPALGLLLDELEPVLLDLVHSPSRLSVAEFEALRARIDEQSLLFKVRVMNGDVRARERALRRPGVQTS